jgi:hypothetical protein
MTGARYGAIFKKEKEKSGYRNKINTRAHLFFYYYSSAGRDTIWPGH